MEPPLAEVIDPDTVDRLLDQDPADSDDGIEIRFTYRGHDVVARANGDIKIR